jgi:hypothetical protein
LLRRQLRPLVREQAPPSLLVTLSASHSVPQALVADSEAACTCLVSTPPPWLQVEWLLPERSQTQQLS